MEVGFWFKSDLFQIGIDEGREATPGCYGRALGHWLCAHFRKLGYDAKELIPEDWGWCVMCTRKPYMLWIGCGAVLPDEFYENHAPDAQPTVEDIVWHVFPHIEVPFMYLKSWIKKSIGRLDIHQPLYELNSELKNILESEPRIELCDTP
jgi:hypothetical protein